MRLGTPYGGWVIPRTLLSTSSICYCAGCGEDISFDLALIESIGCDVFAFDPTPRSIAYVAKVAGGNAKYHFSGIGVWDRTERLKFFAPRDPQHVSHSLVNLQRTVAYIDVPVARLAELMEGNGHERIDLLKIDIEGAEYRVIDSILEDAIPVRVLCVEFDEYLHPIDAAYVERIRASIEKLMQAGYAMCHTERNGNYTFVCGA